jgi:hypothetical protein
MKLPHQLGRLLWELFLNRPNNREIHQSSLSASGHAFEPENSRIKSRIYTVFWYRFLYKILDFKQWLPSVTWSFSRINFIVSLICASCNRNVVFLTEALYEIAASMGKIIGAFVWTDRITVKFVSHDCLLLDMDSNRRTLTYRAESIQCFGTDFCIRSRTLNNDYLQ